ncbi:alpha/beta fold hydrolase [uncultured Mycolicibacterium sp.]|uniref:alpha/beta fold hydrolase n=1 Tax=uncultured Mycolicibacterium sp. TaxID=2320817 RepID=UPI00262C6EE1|nr:alpha/beta hydrolase [uncultured Mycolicibacterium sp.]
MSTDPVSATVTVADLEVAYTRTGAGAPVVFVHGLGQDRHSWRPVLDALDGVTGYAYDLRGHGDTPLGRADGTLAQLRDDLLGFLAAVTGPAICVGFSLGGTVVLAAAAERPDLVTAVVGLGTSSVVGRAAKAFYEQRAALFAEGDREANRQAMVEDTAAALHRPDSDAAAVAAARLAAIGDGAGFVNAATAMARMADEPLTPALARIGPGTPVRLIGADHDALCPRRAADLILEAVPHATYAEVTDAGHLMLVDQPGQVTALLRSALRTAAAG